MKVLFREKLPAYKKTLGDIVGSTLPTEILMLCRMNMRMYRPKHPHPCPVLTPLEGFVYDCRTARPSSLSDCPRHVRVRSGTFSTKSIPELAPALEQDSERNLDAGVPKALVNSKISSGWNRKQNQFAVKPFKRPRNHNVEVIPMFSVQHWS